MESMGAALPGNHRRQRSQSRQCGDDRHGDNSVAGIRDATVDDESLLLGWANDWYTRRNAFRAEHISAESHRMWFLGRLRDRECCRLYLVETGDGVPVGQVRFDRQDDDWQIDYALAPHFRGRGLGRPVLDRALLRMGEVAPGAIVSGRVKQSNQPSCRIFESLHFSETARRRDTRVSTSDLMPEAVENARQLGVEPASRTLVIASCHSRNDLLEERIRRRLPAYQVMRAACQAGVVRRKHATAQS